MPFPRAILFDLDDTIITEGDRAVVLLDVAEELASALAPHNPVGVADLLEIALHDFWSSSPGARTARLAIEQNSIRHAREMVIKSVFREINLAGADEVATQFCDRFTHLRSLGAMLYTGAHATIESLKLAGVRLALVTNGAAHIQRAKIERFNLARHFDHIQIEGELGFGKPDVKAYFHAMEALGVNPSDTWMVGDNLEWEVAVPQSLGIYAIWHDHRQKGLPAGSTVRPDRIIRCLPELLVGS